MSNEAVISNFLQTAYTDERLAMLLAHAEEGRLSYHSCCCVIGVPTADHALEGMIFGGDLVPHYQRAASEFGLAADTAFRRLSDYTFPLAADAQRRTKLIPLIKQEMARREALRPVEEFSLQT